MQKIKVQEKNMKNGDWRGTWRFEQLEMHRKLVAALPETVVWGKNGWRQVREKGGEG